MIFQRSGPILHQSATFRTTHPVTCYREAAGEMLMVSGDIITPWPLSPSPPPCLRVIAVVYSHFRGFHEARAC